MLSDTSWMENGNICLVLYVAMAVMVPISADVLAGTVCVKTLVAVIATGLIAAKTYMTQPQTVSQATTPQKSTTPVKSE